MNILKKTIKYLAKFLTFPKKMSFFEILKDRSEYNRKLNKKDAFYAKFCHDFWCRSDKYCKNGDVDEHYFIQDIWCARYIYSNKPQVHFDVGSSVESFVAHLLSMKQKTVLIDIRSIKNNMNTPFLNSDFGGVSYIQSNATNLEEIETASIDSLSALCSIEHFGLGRYGDPIDPLAWKKALKAFQRVLKTNGKLYLSVPVGKIDKVCFNAHRVFRPQTIIDALDEMQILEMGYINQMNVVSCIHYDKKQCKTFFDGMVIKSIPDFSRGGPTGLFYFQKK